jgi:hypothetical protein
MSNITFSLEKGFRVFKEETNFFHFFMVQFEIDASKIIDGDYTFKVLNKNIGQQTKDIYIDTKKQRIITYNSHEDPLVYENGKYYICFQIEIDLLKKLEGDSIISLFNNKTNIIAETNVLNLNEKYFKYDGTHYSYLIDNTIVSKKECFLTLHLGDKNGEYSEERFPFKANEAFDFSEYIKKYEYIGLQCSYEDEDPEIEEKHIIVGQKGIYLSGYLKLENGEKLEPPLFFKEEYQKEYSIKDFKSINSIEQLLEFYSALNKKPRYFESTLNFLLSGYLNQRTYNQDGLYSDKPISKKNQFVLEVCKNCDKNYKCIQVVPSGLSQELFKQNLFLENHSDCNVYTKIL